MKDFSLRNDTKLWLRNDPVNDLKGLTAEKRVLFVYSNSVKKSGCYEDVKSAMSDNGGTLFEAGNSSREKPSIETGIKLIKENNIDLIIGAGGASVMDSAKLMAFGVLHDDWWDYAKGKTPTICQNYL